MRYRLIAGAALFAVTLAAYSGVGSLGWHARDDEEYVLRAEWISRGVSREGIVRVFSAPHLSNWHPVTSLSHMLDSEFFGPDPGPPHTLNAILHALNAVLLFAALSVFALFGFRGRVYAKLRPGPSDRDEGVIGEIALAEEAIEPGSRGRVSLRGTTWTAENAGDTPLRPQGRARVMSVSGLTLSVWPED